MTSELRDEVSVPRVVWRSRRRVVVEGFAVRWCAVERPITPPPMTFFSLVCLTPDGVRGRCTTWVKSACRDAVDDRALRSVRRKRDVRHITAGRIFAALAERNHGISRAGRVGIFRSREDISALGDGARQVDVVVQGW